MTQGTHCECTPWLTCGYCLRNAKPYHFTPSIEELYTELKPIVEPELIARWESKLGRYWVELYRNTDGSYSYKGDNSGGCLGVMASDTAALDQMKLYVLPYSFPSSYVRAR